MRQTQNFDKLASVLTLNITSPLSRSASHTLGARWCISQQGHGEVQKSTLSSGAPMAASRGTDRENVPLAR